jgi:hypothetical protein
VAQLSKPLLVLCIATSIVGVLCGIGYVRGTMIWGPSFIFRQPTDAALAFDQIKGIGLIFGFSAAALWSLLALIRRPR